MSIRIFRKLPTIKKKKKDFLRISINFKNSFIYAVTKAIYEFQ